MKAEHILSTHVFGESYIDIEKEYREQLIASIELLRRGDVNGRAVSNFSFGWQSQDIPTAKGIFKKIASKIESAAHIFCNTIEGLYYQEVKIDNLWANINYDNDINWPHKHGGDISGVYYLDVSDNCGDLVLTSFNYTENNKISRFLRNKNNKRIKPENKKIVFFDSECVHFVSKNFSGKPRISLSFNLDIHD